MKKAENKGSRVGLIKGRMKNAAQLHKKRIYTAAMSMQNEYKKSSQQRRIHRQPNERQICMHGRESTPPSGIHRERSVNKSKAAELYQLKI